MSLIWGIQEADIPILSEPIRLRLFVKIVSGTWIETPNCPYSIFLLDIADMAFRIPSRVEYL